MIHLTFHELPKLQADVMTRKARMGYREKWHKRVWGEVRVLKDRPKTPWAHAGIVCIRYSANLCDRGNLTGSFKPILDGLTQARVWVDDNPNVLAVESYHFVKSTRKEARVEVFVAEMPSGAEWLMSQMPEGPCAQCGAGVALRDR